MMSVFVPFLCCSCGACIRFVPLHLLAGFSEVMSDYNGDTPSTPYIPFIYECSLTIEHGRHCYCKIHQLIIHLN